jgi:hypothetical protein
MRFGRPNIEHLESPDGSVALTYITTNTDRDLSGLAYSFSVLSSEGSINGTIVVGNDTYMRAKIKAASDGIDLNSLDLLERMRHAQVFSGEFGHHFIVKSLRTSRPMLGEAQVEHVRNRLCDLLIEILSSRRFNDPNSLGGDTRRYSDTLSFVPHELERRFYLEFTVAP